MRILANDFESRLAKLAFDHSSVGSVWSISKMDRPGRKKKKLKVSVAAIDRRDGGLKESPKTSDDQHQKQVWRSRSSLH
jgi:hypothetical protein